MMWRGFMLLSPRGSVLYVARSGILWRRAQDTSPSTRTIGRVGFALGTARADDSA